MTRQRDARISGTPQEALASRLWRDMAEGLAAQAGCCPIHGMTLICALCDVTWTASAGERLEVEALVERSLATQGVTCRAWPCGRCGTQDIALCLDCFEPIREQPVFAGLTAAEEARLGELLGRSLRYTFLPDPDAADHGHDHLMGQRSSHERRETS
jgi:hypothetical protein